MVRGVPLDNNASKVTSCSDPITYCLPIPIVVAYMHVAVYLVDVVGLWLSYICTATAGCEFGRETTERAHGVIQILRPKDRVGVCCL